MKLRLARSTARSNLDLASVRLARACATSASGTAASSRTSSAPFVTRWPSWKAMTPMRPATSGRSVTDSSERRLPTAVIPCGIGANATFAASTDHAGNLAAGPGSALATGAAARRRGGTGRGRRIRGLLPEPVATAGGNREPEHDQGANSTFLHRFS